jgi:CTP synthase (UTP-ammonia lyase)
LVWEEIDSLETAADRLHGYDGILVPGGFGKRGIQGMIYTIQYAREHKIPFFGICLGMQCATIEYARDVAGLKQADSTEFDPQAPYRVIYKLRELLGVTKWAAPCGWARGLASWSRVRLRTRLTGSWRSASAIVIATNSTASMRSLWLRLD